MDGPNIRSFRPAIRSSEYQKQDPNTDISIWSDTVGVQISNMILNLITVRILKENCGYLFKTVLLNIRVTFTRRKIQSVSKGS